MSAAADSELLYLAAYAAPLILLALFLYRQSRQGAESGVAVTGPGEAFPADGPSAAPPADVTLPADLDLRAGLPRAWDNLLYLPQASPAEVYATLRDHDREDRAAQLPHPTLLPELRVYAAVGGGTVVDALDSAHAALDYLAVLRRVGLAAAGDAHVWITVRHNDLDLFVGELQAGQIETAVARAIDEAPARLHAAPTAQLAGLDYEDAVIAHRLLASAPVLGTRLYGTPEPTDHAMDEPTPPAQIALVTSRGHAYTYHDDTIVEPALRKDPLRLRSYRTPREVWQASAVTDPPTGPADGTPGTPAPAWLSHRFADIRAQIRQTRAPRPTETQLEKVRRAGDHLLAVSLSAKHVTRVLAQDNRLAALLETQRALWVEPLPDGRTAVVVARAYGLPVLAQALALLHEAVRDETPAALQAWGTARGSDHLLSRGRLAAGDEYALSRPPRDRAYLTASTPGGTHLKLTDSASGFRWESTSAGDYVTPPEAVVQRRAELAAREPLPEPTNPEDTARLLPCRHRDAAPDDRLVVITKTLTSEDSATLSAGFASSPPDLRPAIAPAGPHTHLRFPAAAPLDHVALVVDELARAFGLGPDDVGGFGTFTAEDAEESTDQQRVTDLALARRETWTAAQDEGGETGAALTGFAEALLPLPGPRMGSQVYLHPVRASREDDPVVGATDEFGLGYRFHTTRATPRWRWVEADVREYHARPA